MVSIKFFIKGTSKILVKEKTGVCQSQNKGKTGNKAGNHAYKNTLFRKTTWSGSPSRSNTSLSWIFQKSREKGTGMLNNIKKSKFLIQSPTSAF